MLLRTCNASSFANTTVPGFSAHPVTSSSTNPSHYDVTLQHLQTVRDLMNDVFDRLLRQSAYRQNATFLAPSLPAELVWIIFDLVIADDMRPLPRLMLSQVCSRWRRIAHSCQSFWSTIGIHRNGQEELLELFARRSASRPLHLALLMPPVSEVAPSSEHHDRPLAIDNSPFVLKMPRNTLRRITSLTMESWHLGDALQHFHSTLGPLDTLTIGPPRHRAQLPKSHYQPAHFIPLAQNMILLYDYSRDWYPTPLSATRLVKLCLRGDGIRSALWPFSSLFAPNLMELELQLNDNSPHHPPDIVSLDMQAERMEKQIKHFDRLKSLALRFLDEDAVSFSYYIHNTFDLPLLDTLKIAFPGSLRAGAYMTLFLGQVYQVVSSCYFLQRRSPPDLTL